MQPYCSAEKKFLGGMMMLLVVTAPVWTYFLFFPGGPSYVAGLVVIPTLVVVNAFLIAFVSNEDGSLTQLLRLAFLLKLAAASMYLFLVKHVLNGGDVLAYHVYGSHIASDFLITGDWASFTASREGIKGGTLFISDVVGALYTVTGPSLSTGVAVFSTIGFWGQYFTYRALTVAFPNGDRSRAGLLLFLFPSNVFWTATMGKDAIISLSLGLAAYGFATLVRRGTLRAYFYIVIGLAGVYCVRPHIAAMIAMAFTAAYAFGNKIKGFFGVAVKIGTIPLLSVGSFFLFRQAQKLLNAENMSKALLIANNMARNTNYGGSAIGASGSSLFYRIVTAPFLLFRPFPWEVNNLQAGLACAEAVVLFVLFWAFRAQVKFAARRWYSDPFLLFVFLYIAQFSVLVAGTFSNIGLIARQRVMMLPFALMLLCSCSGEPASDIRRFRNTVRSRSKQTEISSTCAPIRRPQTLPN